MERPDLHEQSRDDALLEWELRQAELEDREVSPAAARLLASRWHDGQASWLHGFARCGAIDRDAVYEVRQELLNHETTPAGERELVHLLHYLMTAPGIDENGERGVVEGGHELTRWDYGQWDTLFDMG